MQDAGLSAPRCSTGRRLRPPDARGAGRTRCAPPSTPTRDGATGGALWATALDRRRASRRRRWRGSASSAGSGIPSARRRVASSRPRSTDASAPSGSPSRCSRSLAASIAATTAARRAAGQRVPCVERFVDPSEAAKQVGPIDGDAAFIPWPAEGLPAMPSRQRRRAAGRSADRRAGVATTMSSIAGRVGWSGSTSWTGGSTSASAASAASRQSIASSNRRSRWNPRASPARSPRGDRAWWTGRRGPARCGRGAGRAT